MTDKICVDDDDEPDAPCKRKQGLLFIKQCKYKIGCKILHSGVAEAFSYFSLGTLETVLMLGEWMMWPKASVSISKDVWGRRCSRQCCGPMERILSDLQVLWFSALFLRFLLVLSTLEGQVVK